MWRALRVRRRGFGQPPRADVGAAPGARTPRVPGRAHLPLLHSCPGGVQWGTTTRGAATDPRRPLPGPAKRPSDGPARPVGRGRRATPRGGPQLATPPRTSTEVVSPDTHCGIPIGASDVRTHVPSMHRTATETISGDPDPLVASPAEDSHSGLVRTIGNRVGIKPSGVQIPHPPPPGTPGQPRDRGFPAPVALRQRRAPPGNGRGARPAHRGLPTRAGDRCPGRRAPPPAGSVPAPS